MIFRAAAVDEGGNGRVRWCSKLVVIGIEPIPYCFRIAIVRDRRNLGRASLKETAAWIIYHNDRCGKTLDTHTSRSPSREEKPITLSVLEIVFST